MAGFNFGIEVRGVQNFRRMALRLRDAGENDEAILKIIGGVLEASTRRRFDTGVGVGGVPWIPSRRAIREGNKTLVQRGDLENAIRYEVRAREVEVGIDAGRGQGRSESARNAPALQFGSRRQTVVQGHTRTINSAFGVPLPSPRQENVRPHARTTNLPARPFIGVDAEDKREVYLGMLDHLKGLFR